MFVTTHMGCWRYWSSGHFHPIRPFRRPNLKPNPAPNICWLQEAVKNCEYWRLIDEEGKPPGLLGWWPSKATTFIDNHDTGVRRAAVGLNILRLDDNMSRA